MILVKIRRHPRLDGVAVVAVPADGNAIMGRFGAARLSPPDRGYLVPDEHVEALKRLLGHHECRVIDSRDEALPEIGPLPYDPLPECAACGHPVARDLAETYVNCPACAAPWVVHQPERWEPTGGPADPEAGAAAALERLARGLRRARAELGPSMVPPADAAASAAARAVRCPWCGVPPLAPCVNAATGQTLTISSAHPARHEAAGVGAPLVARGALAARRSQPGQRAAGER